MKIHAVSVASARAADLETRFRSCRAGLGGVPGFLRLALLRPTGDGGRYFVVTWWESDAAFCEWLAQGREIAHGVSSSLVVDGELLEFEVVDLPSL